MSTRSQLVILLIGGIIVVSSLWSRTTNAPLTRGPSAYETLGDDPWNSYAFTNISPTTSDLVRLEADLQQLRQVNAPDTRRVYRNGFEFDPAAFAVMKSRLSSLTNHLMDATLDGEEYRAILKDERVFQRIFLGESLRSLQSLDTERSRVGSIRRFIYAQICSPTQRYKKRIDSLNKRAVSALEDLSQAELDAKDYTISLYRELERINEPCKAGLVFSPPKSCIVKEDILSQSSLIQNVISSIESAKSSYQLQVNYIASISRQLVRLPSIIDDPVMQGWTKEEMAEMLGNIIIRRAYILGHRWESEKEFLAR